MENILQNVDAYINGFDEKIQTKLREMRDIILDAVPQAEEVISYGMPTYKYHGILVHFAGWQHHIGFYPTPSAIIAFKDRLQTYETSKGTVKFPVDQELPVKLIKEMIAFRVKENLVKEKERKEKRKKKK